VALEQATRKAYNQTTGTAVARAAENSGDVLTWYGHALWDRLPLYGVRPPAITHEEIPRDKWNMYVMKHHAGRIVLCESYGKGRYEHILMHRADLSAALRSIREVADSFSDDPGRGMGRPKRARLSGG
jgi:hypothetical protein